MKNYLWNILVNQEVVESIGWPSIAPSVELTSFADNTSGDTVVCWSNGGAMRGRRAYSAVSNMVRRAIASAFVSRDARSNNLIVSSTESLLMFAALIRRSLGSRCSIDDKRSVEELRT